MKGMSFYQVRRDGPLSASEVEPWVRQAIISFYPGTSQEDALAAFRQSTPGFFLSRAAGTEIIWGLVLPEGLNQEHLDSLRSQAATLETGVRGFLPRVRSFLVFIFAPDLDEKAREGLKDFGARWSFFEYFFLQAENEEGLALRKLEQGVLPENPATIEKSAEPETLFSHPQRLSADELNALIDLSLALELRNRGLPPGT